jgi:hypothetical protein
MVNDQAVDQQRYTESAGCVIPAKLLRKLHASSSLRKEKAPMTHEPKRFVVIDPRMMDGDPFEVADRACKQAEAVARILTGCIEGANIMARNSEMERNLMESDDAQALDWEASPQGKRYAALTESVRLVEGQLKLLGRAASYNPKKPPKEA